MLCGVRCALCEAPEGTTHRVSAWLLREPEDVEAAPSVVSGHALTQEREAQWGGGGQGADGTTSGRP